MSLLLVNNLLSLLLPLLLSQVGDFRLLGVVQILTPGLSALVSNEPMVLLEEVAGHPPLAVVESD